MNFKIVNFPVDIVHAKKRLQKLINLRFELSDEADTIMWRMEEIGEDLVRIDEQMLNLKKFLDKRLKSGVHDSKFVLG